MATVPALPLSDTLMIQYIRSIPSLEKLWSEASKEEKKRILADAEGDTWHLQELMEDVLDESKQNRRRSEAA